jgi:hypothetical protein
MAATSPSADQANGGLELVAVPVNQADLVSTSVFHVTL